MSNFICIRGAFVALSVSFVLAACASQTSPEQSSLSISNPTPASGTVATTQIGTQYFVAKDSGRFSVPITVTSNREVPFAQLYVYLRDDSPGLGYCGQNLPDTPAWGPFRKGQTERVVISGWQISRSPCIVTSIRAYLHVRNNGALTPPIEAETVATGSLTLNGSYTFSPSN